MYSSLSRVSDIANLTSGVPCDDREIGYVPRHHGAGTNQCTLAHDNSGQNDSAAAYRSALFHPRGHNRPVRVRLRTSIIIGRSRKAVVCKHDAMSNENFVFNGYAFAKKTVR